MPRHKATTKRHARETTNFVAAAATMEHVASSPSLWLRSLHTYEWDLCLGFQCHVLIHISSRETAYKTQFYVSSVGIEKAIRYIKCHKPP